MVYDTIIFFKELDLLEIRLNTLKDVVDRFVIVEMSHTHAGEPKSFYLGDHLDDFKGFPIYYVTVEPSQQVIDAGSWEMEYWHRRQLQEMLRDIVKEDDIIVFSDTDEIPKPDTLAERHLGRYEQKMYYFHLNTYAYQWISGTIVLSAATAMERDFQELRMDRSIQIVPNGGWHFSSVGDRSAVVDKMKSFSHTEYRSDEAITQVLTNYDSMHSIHGEELLIHPLSELPEYIQQNEQKFKHLLWHSSASTS